MAPTIVGGQLKPEILEAMKSPSPPPPSAKGEGKKKKEVITTKEDAPNSDGDDKNVEIPLDSAEADKRHVKASSPSAAALLAQEILSPIVTTVPESFGPYVPPTAVEAGDMNALQELDERKIIELREAFNLFDLDHNGCIDAEDLKATFCTLGADVSDEFVQRMLADGMDPMEFESFVLMYGIRTIEMDPEEVLLEAMSKWDKERTGQISMER